MKKEFDIEDEWLPLEIHPETPKKGKLIAEVFPAASMERMYASLKNAGKSYGIVFKANELLSNSHLALAAGEYAKDQGKFEEFHESIFHAYFTEEKDIGDIEVLSSIAEDLGLDKEEMLQKLEDGTYENVLHNTQSIAHQYDIGSTPTFIIDDKYAIVGAQSIENFKNALLEIEKQ